MVPYFEDSATPLTLLPPPTLGTRDVGKALPYDRPGIVFNIVINIYSTTDDSSESSYYVGYS